MYGWLRKLRLHMYLDLGLDKLCLDGSCLNGSCLNGLYLDRLSLHGLCLPSLPLCILSLRKRWMWHKLAINLGQCLGIVWLL